MIGGTAAPAVGAHHCAQIEAVHDLDDEASQMVLG